MRDFSFLLLQGWGQTIKKKYLIFSVFNVTYIWWKTSWTHVKENLSESKNSIRILAVGLQVTVGMYCIGILSIKDVSVCPLLKEIKKGCIETSALHYLENSNSTRHGCQFHTSRLFHSVGTFISKKANSTSCWNRLRSGLCVNQSRCLKWEQTSFPPASQVVFFGILFWEILRGSVKEQQPFQDWQ